MTSNKPLQFVKKRVLHIDPDERYSRQPKDLEKRATDAVAQTYIEEEPSIRELGRQLIPTREGCANYMRGLFPSATWIGRYNLHWLMGDAIAGEPHLSRIYGITLKISRSYNWLCCRSAGNGVCSPCEAQP